MISKNTYTIDQLIEQLLREHGPLNPRQIRVLGADRHGVVAGQMIYLRFKQQLKSISKTDSFED